MRAPEFWHRSPGLVSGLLAPLSAGWRIGARLRNSVVRPHRAAVPVICVGNLVAGGAGKTPIVLALTQMLVADGRAVHIVSRGYGGRLAGPVRVDPLRHDAEMVGDEPLLLAAAAPCWIAHDRAAGVAAASEGADVVLLDDGFQNPAVIKDCGLVVVDAAYGFGNSRVIPAGPLREPVDAGLARASGIVLLGDGPTPAAVVRADRPVFRASLEPVSAQRLAGRPVIAFAGIGRPEKFFATLRGIGAQIVESHVFADHHRYAEAELGRLRRAAEAAHAALVTTTKDWVRLPAGGRAEIDVLDVEIRWRDEPAMHHFLANVAHRSIRQDNRHIVPG